jgi:hypothetical protein
MASGKEVGSLWFKVEENGRLPVSFTVSSSKRSIEAKA